MPNTYTTNLNLTDMETCYKAFRTELIKRIPLRSNGFGFEPEITVKIAKLGCRVFEVPISYHGRDYAEGKKIGWKDGVSALWSILRYNLLPPKAGPWDPPEVPAWETSERRSSVPARDPGTPSDGSGSASAQE